MSTRSKLYGWGVLLVAAAAMVGTLPGRTQGLGLITEPLLKVAALVSAFTALQFAVQAVTDAGYRTDFFDDVIGQLSDTLVAREVYLAGLEQHELTPSSRRFSWRNLDEL